MTASCASGIRRTSARATSGWTSWSPSPHANQRLYVQCGQRVVQPQFGSPSAERSNGLEDRPVGFCRAREVEAGERDLELRGGLSPDRAEQVWRDRLCALVVGMRMRGPGAGLRSA